MMNLPEQDWFVERILVPYSRERWGNAQVSVAQDKTGRKMVIKDFGFCPWFIRHTTGRFLLWRESRALRRLQQIEGMPGPPVIREKWRLIYPYVEGFTLRDEKAREYHFDKCYFEDLEALVMEMHRNNVVHLDLRNARNVLVTNAGKPALIDFQTTLFTDFMPGFLRRLLFRVDLTGVYKHWKRLLPDTLTDERMQVNERMKSLRPFWFIKGYPVREFLKKIRGRKK
jgi:hypothetical protein